jgi:hypothetical protein
MKYYMANLTDSQFMSRVPEFDSSFSLLGKLGEHLQHIVPYLHVWGGGELPLHAMDKTCLPWVWCRHIISCVCTG